MYELPTHLAYEEYYVTLRGHPLGIRHQLMTCPVSHVFRYSCEVRHPRL